ncbi:unnamed protein product [Tilletia laevis]|uniref:DNA helicase n=3 Tax=Tilletia TaxID=13289 RepID=A0A8X7MYN4_9BASI|nr:hypothetical protein CF336_g1065 [Tilletia laevis]KAE8204651.1 hypothetical protein CF328_g968 [Tilletia controversa]KAE8264853.1 hypothetical protein A4X03_0g655 [Tilletia caries]KAE8208231.1 hypothetical protein CF335_g576 [Tilletia laevis]KAE8253605.1 hypothetical protein A4X06_0g1328 [Tilletia controversa]
MESYLKHGLDKVPRLSTDAARATALLLHPNPTRWDWRQRATSRVLAREASRPRTPTAGSSSNAHRNATASSTRARRVGSGSGAGGADAAGSSSSQHRNASSTAKRGHLFRAEADSNSAASVWATFGRTIPAQLRDLPLRIQPPRAMLLGKSVASSGGPKIVMKRTRKTSLGKGQEAKSKSKGKGKAKATEAFNYLGGDDAQFAGLLAQHHKERAEVLLPTIKAYAARLSTLLDHERDAKRKELDARQARPVSKLVEQGIAIDGLQAYWQGGDIPAASTAKRRKSAVTATAALMSMKRSAIFKLSAGRPMEWNRFKVGDKVELSHGTGALFLDAFGSGEGGSGFGIPESQLGAASQSSATLLDADHKGSGPSSDAPTSSAARTARPVGVILEKTPFRLRVMFDLSQPVASGLSSSSSSSLDTLLHSRGRPVNVEAELENCTSWRLDLGENDLVEIRMREALQALEHDIDVLERVALLPTEQQLDELDDVQAAWLSSITSSSSSLFSFPPVRRSEYVLSGCKVLDALLDVLPPSLRRFDSAAALDDNFRARVSPSTTFDADCRIHSWARRYDRDDPIVIDGDPDLGGLNESQVRAVAMMLRNRVSLVQGPPGTGKTRTIVETIRLLKQHFEVPQPILLTAHTNVAVDNLAEGCRLAGLRVVRAGSSAKAAGGAAADALQAEADAEQPSPKKKLPEAGQQNGHVGRPGLAECTIDSLMAKHPAKRELNIIRARLMAERMRLGEMYAALEYAGKSIPIITDTGDRGVDERDLLPIMPVEDPSSSSGSASSANPLPKPADVAYVRKKVTQLAQLVFLKTQVILSHILHSADVVCTTALSASSISLRSIDFPIVFFDEGSMATEPIALVPMMKGCEHLAIIGDHRQLPPVVCSSAARAGGLGQSLFERLIGADRGVKQEDAGEQDEVAEAKGNVTRIPSTMLTVQHRMHPSLSLFPNRTFYAGVLQDGLRTGALEPLQTGFSQLLSNPHMGFLAHTSPEQRVDNSLQNTAEARMACELVASLLLRNPTLPGDGIGIVTPYVAQVLLLSRWLRADLGGGMRERMDAALVKMEPTTRKTVLEQLSKAGTSVAERAKEALDVEVHTVDGFEGREKAAIVFSTVRTNAGGYVGFLADGRRLNVALTRAQRGLFVLGNIKTWERARVGEVGDREMDRSDVTLLKAYAAYLKEQGAILPIDAQGFAF